VIFHWTIFCNIDCFILRGAWHFVSLSTQ
jgi:hypothetical protein